MLSFQKGGGMQLLYSLTATHWGGKCFLCGKAAFGKVSENNAVTSPGHTHVFSMSLSIFCSHSYLHLYLAGAAAIYLLWYVASQGESASPFPLFPSPLLNSLKTMP